MYGLEMLKSRHHLAEFLLCECFCPFFFLTFLTVCAVLVSTLCTTPWCLTELEPDADFAIGWLMV